MNTLRQALDLSAQLQLNVHQMYVETVLLNVKLNVGACRRFVERLDCWRSRGCI